MTTCPHARTPLTACPYAVLLLAAAAHFSNIILSTKQFTYFLRFLVLQVGNTPITTDAQILSALQAGGTGGTPFFPDGRLSTLFVVAGRDYLFTYNGRNITARWATVILSSRLQDYGEGAGPWAHGVLRGGLPWCAGSAALREWG